MSKRRTFAALIALGGLLTTGASHAGPFAEQVVSYTPGTPVGVGNPAPYQTDGSQALGAPSHDTAFGSQVGVFYPPFWTDELVIVGVGGQLTVKMGSRVEDDPLNPFGVDLLVHGNAFFGRDQNDLVTGVSSEPGIIEVSSNGTDWFTVIDRFADDAFPTLGYTDTVFNGFGNAGGTIKTDWELPVDPAFDPLGKTEAQVNAGYNGSGGGTGVDLLGDLAPGDYAQLLVDGQSGLPYVEYVRISQPGTDTWSTEVQAFVDVAPIPEPASLALLGAGGLELCLRRKRSA